MSTSENGFSHRSSEEEEDDDDDDRDPLEELVQTLGVARGEAVDVLMRCGGDVDKARLQLLHQTSLTNDTDRKANDAKGGGRNKKRSKAKTRNKDNNSNNDDDDAAAGSQQQDKDDDGSSHHKKKSFKDQRKQELRFQKALRDQRRVCRVCGGPHARKECPGIADDGRGHSRHRDARAKKKDNQKRKEFRAQKQRDEEFLQIGVWTGAAGPYYDGFADLVQAYYHRHSHNNEVTTSSEQQPSRQNEGLARWILDWATLQVKLGEDPIRKMTPDQRKTELKTWSGSRLQKKARALSKGDDRAVDAALRDRNPRSALIQIVLAAMQRQEEDEDSPEQRTLNQEWPGYRGCVAPFSVLDDSAMYALEELQSYHRHHSTENNNEAKHDGATNTSTTIMANGVKALLSIPPAEVAKWMVLAAEDDASNDSNINNDQSEPMPIDVSFFTTEAQEIERIQAASKHAQQQLLASGRKARASAEAQVMRLRKAMAGRRARQVDSEELLQGAAKACLDPAVLKFLDDALEQFSEGIAGVSCGLNYDTAEARHPVLGKAVREAQKLACRHAVEVAVKLRLPIVLECQEASIIQAKTCDGEHRSSSGSGTSSSASSDLVRVLVEAAPPETTLLLRNGSLTTAAKPGTQRLLDTWPNLYLGMSASLAYSKCPKELLDVVYDVPLDRLCLASEAPFCLPPMLSGSHLVDDCVPPHVACICETVAKVKSATRQYHKEEVLQASTLTVARLFGFEKNKSE